MHQQENRLRLTPESPPSTTIAGAELTAVLLLGYGIIMNRLVPEAFYVPANLAAAGAAVRLARELGLSDAEMGTERGPAAAGLKLGVLAAAPAPAAVALGLATPLGRRYLGEEGLLFAQLPRTAYELLLRIPFGTALSEELLFRGVLLGLFRKRYSLPTALALSSLAFGAWHIPPSVRMLAGASTHRTGARQALIVGGLVTATTCAGLVFSLLRLRSRTVAAPWAAHWVINATGFLFGSRLLIGSVRLGDEASGETVETGARARSLLFRYLKTSLPGYQSG